MAMLSPLKARSKGAKGAEGLVRRVQRVQPAGFLKSTSRIVLFSRNCSVIRSGSNMR
jgi:hypothetical protein